MTTIKLKPRINLFRTIPRNPQFGFSLIEFMIAITIGLLIMVALIALLLNIIRSNNELAKTNMLIENGRFAIQVMQQDIVHAGFWGNYVPEFDNMTLTAVPTDAPTEVPDLCLAYPWGATPTLIAAYKTNLIGIPVQGYDAVPTAPTDCSGLLDSKQDDTDILVVRHAETCVAGAGSCEADTAGKLYFQSSLCQPPVLDPMVADAPPYYILDTTNFGTLNQKDCDTDVTEKRKFISSIYYIRDYATTAGDGIPTLVRSQFDLSGGALAHQAPAALIEGIEGFNVELGIDSLSDNGTNVIDDADPLNRYTAAIKWADRTNLTSPTNRGDGNPDSFVSCTTATPCTKEQLSNVVAVKLYVLARNSETTLGYTDTKTYTLGNTTLGPFNDNYKRHVFSSAVRLINVSGRRETP